MSRRFLLAVLAVVASACDPLVGPSNPFDLDTPPDQQARASLSGTIEIADTSDDAIRNGVLGGIRIGLLDEDGRRLQQNGVAVSRELADVAVSAPGVSQGTFAFSGDLIPGTYTVVVDNAPAFYQAPTLPTVRLLPGAAIDVGALRYEFVGGVNDGPGRINGDVRAEGGAAGQHRVTLFRHRNGTTELVRSVVTDAAFDFGGLTLDRYAVVVESEGFTPVYRLGVVVGAQPDGVTVVQHQFAGDDALVVHPITAALQPAIGDPTVVLDEGLVFVRGDVAPLLVLPFVSRADLELGITGMRLSTSATFVDAAGAPVPFVPHQATTSVTLPATDGATQIFAQFEARSADNAFAFVSPTVSLGLIRDTTAPVVETVTVQGGVLSTSRTVNVVIETTDATSAVDAFGVAFDTAPVVLTDVTATPGLQRLAQDVTSDTDGVRDVVVLVEDRAGNRSAPVRLPVTIDTVAPSVALNVVGADDGFLRARVATLDVTSLIAADTQLTVAVGLEGDVNELDDGPLGRHDVVLPANLAHGASVTFEAVAFDVVGNRTAVTKTVILDLRGSVSGAVVSDGVPGVLDTVGGAVVTLVDGRGVVAGGPTTVGATGDFSFAGIVEGRGYTLRAVLAGHADAVVRNIAVDLDSAVDLGDVPLVLARGELRGRALLSDVVNDVTAHGGVSVSASLSSSTRTFADTAVTDQAGNWTIRGVPQTLSGEVVNLSAQVTDYGSATAEVQVAAGVTTAPDLLLPRGRGDFDVCRTADPSCTIARDFNADTFDIRLRDSTDVVAIHVAVDGGAAERLPLGGNGRTTVSVAGRADGELTISVQAEKTDGSRSEVLSSTIIRDTTPPTGVTIERRSNPLARDPRFTNASFVDVVVDADAGIGAVSPLGTARVVLADAAPALPAAGFVSCTHEATCRVTLPNQERLLRVFAFSCDAAGNCAAPVETFVVRDTTPPGRANGAAFRVAATGSVVSGTTTILASPFYSGVIDTGAARTLAGTAVVDESGQGVAEVFAFRFSLSQANLQNVAIQTFIDPPAAGETRDGADIVVPPLPAGDGARQVFAQFVDAAGNTSQEQIVVDLLVDTTGPVAIVVVNGGQATASLSVPFAVTVPVGAEAPVRVELTVDDGAAQVFTLPIAGTERLQLPPVDGLRRIVINAVDRVGNVTRNESSILLDRGPPRVDAARCTSLTCTDAGFGELLSRASDARIDLALTVQDALSTVDRIEVSSVPAAPGGTQVLTLVGGTLSGVGIAANASSTLSLVPIDAVGNRGAAFVRAVRHDVTPPTIASVTIESGAARTRNLQVTVQTAVPANDAVELRLATTTSFSGPFSVFRADEFFTFAGADGDRQVCVEVRDAAGNTASACDTITLDRTAPAGSVTVAAPIVRTAAVNAALVFPVDTAQVAASTASLTCDPATTPYIAATTSPQTVPVALDGADGTRTIVACFRDGAGNVAQATTTVTVDRTAPVASLALDSGAAFATTTTPTARVTASTDATGLALSVDTALDCAAATYVAFTSTPLVTLPSAQGPHTVRACVRDEAGNVSVDPAAATIVLDTVRPSSTVLVNGGAPFASSSSVTISLTASQDATAMAVQNVATLDCATATYVTFLPTFAHQLTAGDGAKTVSVCVRDAAGLVAAASAADTIVVDTTAPTGTLVVAGGAETTAVASVSAVLSGQSADVAFVAVTASPIACDTAAFEPIGGVTTFDVVLPLPNTTNVVTACLKDGAGNIGAITDAIFFENAAGDALVVAINGGAGSSRSRDVTVSLFRPSTEFNQMKVAEAQTLDCDNLTGYEAFIGSKAITLSTGAAPAEGQRTISACVRSTTNGLTRAASDSIFLDTFAPDGAIVINGGAVTSSATVTAALSNAFAGDGEVITVALSETSTIGGGGLCTGSFEAFSAARTFTFTGADGSRSLFACLRDGAGNTREVQDAIVLDRAPPSPVLISVPALTSSTTISVGLTFPVDAVQVAIAEGALDCLTSQAYVAAPPGASPSLPLTLSAADGTRTVAACFKDAAGNTSQATGTTTLDRTQPSGTVVVDSGATFSTDLTVSVAIQNATDAVRMARVESAAPINCAVQSYVAFVSPLDLVLAAGDGTRTIQVCLEDAAGNRALALADSIVVDRTAPDGSLSINSGAVATNTRNVSLAIGTGVHTDVTAFAVAEGTITCNASNLAYAPFAPSAPFALTAAQELKTVLVCLKDQAGNVSSTAATDTITLDTAAPIGAAVAVNDGDGFLNGEGTTALTVTWTTAGDVAAVKVGEGAVDCQSETGYTAVAAASTSLSVPAFAVSAGDGTKLILACLRDGAGNVATAQDTTIRDTTAPVVTAVVCPGCVSDGGQLLSRSASVALAVTADEGGSGVASARVAVDAGAEVALPLVNGVVTVSALAEGNRTLRVKAVDRAGNTSAVSRDVVVTVDVTAPTLAQLTLNGSAAAGNATDTRAVAVGIVGASADTAQMAVVEGNGAVAQIPSCATATYAPFVPEFTRTLPAVDGAKAVSVCLRDRAGNVSALPTTQTITLDTVGVSLPVTPILVLDGDGFLQAETTTSIRLTWTTNGDARQAKVQEGIVNCESDADYVTLPVNTNTIDLPAVPVSAADGTKTFGACFRDAAGNVVVAQGSTVRDATAPVVTAVTCPACTVDNGTLFSRSTSATLLVSAIENGAGVASARVSRNGGALTTFAVTAGQLTVTSLVQGANTVLVKLVDGAGNLTGDATDVELTLTVDTTLPNLAAGGLRLNGLSAGGATNASLVTASIVGAPTDAAGLFLVEAASAPNCAAATYGPFTLASSLQLSGGDGDKTVFACLRDRAGNTSSAAVSASIRLDTTVPSLPTTSVTIEDGGDNFLTSVGGGVSVRLNWNTVGDVVAVKASENSVDCGSEPYDRPVGIAGVNTVTLTAVPLSSVDGTKVVAVCFKDAAGNVTSAQDSTTLDQGGPNGAIVINDGALFTTSATENVTVTARMAEDTARFAIAETVNAACTTATLNCASATYETFTGVAVDGIIKADKVINLSGAAAAVEGAKCIEACFEDEAGNRTSTASLARITFDKTAPTVAAGDVTLTGTPAGATTRTAQIAVTVQNAPADTTTFRISEDNTFGAGAQPFVAFSATAQAFLLSPGDGAKTVFVQLRDAAGNVGAATQKGITLDATAPEAVSVTINSGDTFASAVGVTLALSATGATQMQIAVDGVPDTEPFVDFATSAAATLLAPDGSKLVAVRFRDAAGNVVVASDGITLDRAAPVGGTVVVNDGAAVTNNTTVTLGITPPADAATMSVNGGPFVGVASVALSAVAAGDCLPGELCKTVSVVFRDNAGNAGTAATDTISLDTVPPSSVSVSLVSATAGDAAGFTTSGTVNASFAFATGAGNATSVKHGEGAVDCATANGYVALSPTSPFAVTGLSLSSGDGQKSYVACFRDAAGNVTSAATSIVADRTRPFGVIVLNGGAATTRTTAVTVSVTPATDDVTRVAFINAATAPTCSAVASGAFVDVQPTLPHTLAAGDGAKTVFACFRDGAGNASTLTSQASITLDGTAPSVAFALVGNTGAQSGQTNTRTITVNIGTLSSDAREIALGEGTLACADAPYEPVPQPVTLPLARTFILADGPTVGRTVSVCARDAAGNVSGVNGTTAGISLDVQAPQVTVSINAGASFATSTAATVTLTSAIVSDPLRRFVSQDPTVDCAQVPDTSFVGATFAALPATTTATLSSGDGEKFVAICFKDAAGNIARFGDSITLDQTRPVAAFVVDSGASFSLDTTVTGDFSLVDTDTTQMQVTRTTITDCSSATFGAFVNNGNVTSLVEGTNTIFACLRDAAGNVSDANSTVAGNQPFTDTIIVDTLNPTLSAFVVGPQGGPAPDSGFVPSIDVQLRTLSSALSTDVVSFAVGNTSLDCGTASYDLLPQPLPTVLLTNHTLAAGADGARTVVVCVKDAAGRTGSQSANTTLDVTPPQVLAFAINGGASITNGSVATVTATASPSNDSLRAVLSANPAFSCSEATFSGAFASLPTSTTATLSSGDGNKFIVGCFQDRAGNLATASDDITLDTVAPGQTTAPCTNCNLVGTARFTNTSAATIGPVGPSSDVTSVLTVMSRDLTSADRACTATIQCRTGVGETCSTFPTSTAGVTVLRCLQTHTSLDAISVALGTAAAPVPNMANEGLQQYMVAYVDGAGNMSRPVSGEVVRDITAPLISFSLSAGTVTNQQTVFVQALTVAGELLFPGATRLGQFQASALSTFADAATLDFLSFGASDVIPVTLTAGDGSKTVSVRFTDNAGNVATGSVLTRSVVLDTTAPTTPQFAGVGVVTNAVSFALTDLPIDSVDASGLRATRPYDIFIPAVAAGTTTCAAISSALISGAASGECQWNGITTVNVTLQEGENRIQVRGVDAAGNRSDADVIVVTKDSAAPTAPSNLTLTERDGEVVVRWSPSTSSDVAGYRVFYGTTGSNAKSSLLGTFASEGPAPLDVGNRLTATLSGLPNNSSVFIGVEAYDRAAAGTPQTACTGPAGPPFNCSGLSTVVEALPNVVTPVVLDAVTETLATMTVQGTRAYGLRVGGGFVVYDVSDPSNMSLLGSVSAVNVPEDGRLIPDGNFLYAIDSTLSGLRPLSVSNPTSVGVFSPTAIGTSNRFYVDATFAGTRGYGLATIASGGTSGVLTILKRSTTTSSPTLTEATSLALSPTTETSPRPARCLASDDRRIVVGYGENGNGTLGGLQVITRSGDTLTSASILDLEETGVSDVIIHGNRLIAAVNSGNDSTGERGIQIYGLTNDTLTSTDLLANVANVECTAIAAEGPYLYCAEGGAGPANRVVILDIRTNTPRVVGREVINGVEAPLLTSIGVADTTVFAIDSNSDLISFELTDLARARSSGALGSGFTSAAVAGRFAWVSGNLGTIPLTAIDLLNPEAPVLARELDLGAECPVSRSGCGSSKIGVNGSVVVVANNANGLVSDEGHIVLVDGGNPLRDVAVKVGSSIVVDAAPRAIVVRRNVAFVMTSNRIRSFRIDPDVTPTALDDEVVFAAGDDANDLVAQDGMLYAVSETGVLKIINAANPATLSVLAATLTVPSTTIEVDGPFLFAAQTATSNVSGAIRIVDISTGAGGVTSYINPVPAFETGSLDRPAVSLARAGTRLLAGIGLVTGAGSLADGVFAFKPRSDMATVSVGLENRSVNAPTELRMAGPFAFGFSSTGGLQILEYQR